MNDEIDRKIDVTAMQFRLVQNRQQTHDWTLIGSGTNGLGIQECIVYVSWYESYELEEFVGENEFLLDIICSNIQIIKIKDSFFI